MDIQAAAKQWDLRELQTFYRQETRGVWTAESEQYGPVILKWDSTGQLASEHRMLSRQRGHRSCKVFAYDGEQGLLLEERILPGTRLREEPSLEKRVEALASVFREIHQPEPEGETYLDWLERACAFCGTREVPGELDRMAARACGICGELFAAYPERVLLHGDLHQDNLLRRADGSYALIDPKGVVGPPILDLLRFLLNEADLAADGGHMDRALRLVSGACGFPEGDLRKGLFMEAVLANVWFVEDGMEMNRRWMELTEMYGEEAR